MALCDRCINKGNCGVQEFFEEGKLLLSYCKNFIGKAPREIKTNFQRITASPEALAKWLEESIGSFCDTYNGEVDCEKCPIADDCDVIEQKRLKQLRDNSTDNISISDKDYWLAWLKQESE